MNIIGVIIEFNPFHNGHKHFLNAIKQNYPNSLIIGVMSGNVVQRGEFSIQDKFRRSEEGIKNGMDIIIENPSFPTLNSASYFATSAVSILNKFKVEKIIFGSESNNINQLITLASKMNSDEFKESISSLIKTTQSYAKAIEIYFCKKLTPNDILGTSYISAGREINRNIQFEAIQRNPNYKSASKKRKELLSKISFNKIKFEKVIDMNKFFQIFKSFLYTYNGDSDEIKYLSKRITEYKGKSWYEFINQYSNKSFTKARLRREFLKKFLNLNNQQDETNRVLGLSKIGKEYLNLNKDISYTTKFINEFKNELKISSVIDIKYKGIREKEINSFVFLKD